MGRISGASNAGYAIKGLTVPPFYPRLYPKIKRQRLIGTSLSFQHGLYAEVVGIASGVKIQRIST